MKVQEVSSNDVIAKKQWKTKSDLRDTRDPSAIFK